MSDWLLFVLVFTAAVSSAVHALLLKKSKNRHYTFLISNSCYLLAGCLLVWFVDVPESAAWPYLIGSSVFTAIQIILSKMALARGDLTTVWPVGSSVKFLTLVFFAAAIFSEPITAFILISVLLIIAGIWLIDLAQPGTASRPAVVYSALFGFFLGIQLLIAAQGIKLVSDPVTYIVWDAFTVLPSIVLTFWFNHIRWRQLPQHLTLGVAAGLSDMISYGVMLCLFFISYVGQIIIWKQSSLLIVLVLSAVFLKEPVTKTKIMAFLLITAGLLFGSY